MNSSIHWGIPSQSGVQEPPERTKSPEAEGATGIAIDHSMLQKHYRVPSAQKPRYSLVGCTGVEKLFVFAKSATAEMEFAGPCDPDRMGLVNITISYIDVFQKPKGYTINYVRHRRSDAFVRSAPFEMIDDPGRDPGPPAQSC